MSRNVQRIQNFIGKYRFPIHLFILYDTLVAKCSTCLSTCRVKLVLRLLGCRYGANLRVDGPVVIRVHKKGAIRLGENVRINSRFLGNLAGITNPTVLCCTGEGSISIGDHSGCTSTIFSSRSGIHVGRNVKIGANVRIFDHDYHSPDYLERRADIAKSESFPVIIEDDVFIGTNATVLKGVRVGARSIIGAGAVVATKEIPPDSLVVGNPARVVKSLVAEDQP